LVAAAENDLAGASLEQERSGRKGSEKRGVRRAEALERRKGGEAEAAQRRDLMAEMERIGDQFVERIGGGNLKNNCGGENG
jgi:hypothetical protein